MCRFRMSSVWIVVLASLAAGAFAPKAQAGQGEYDPKTRSFSVSYIYLDLPSNSISMQSVLSSRARTRPTADQQQNVERFLKLVSDSLFRLTAGRAKIGSLVEVQDIQKADVVISLTGNVKPQAGGAWAAANGWGTPGATLNLYYQDLLNDQTGNVTLTVIHELCHYFFGLPDEYPATTGPALCPRGAPNGDQCIMDNFHNGGARGFCTKDRHNPLAPGANGYPPVFPNKRNLSCAELVDEFFDRYGVKPDSVSGLPTEPIAMTTLPPGLREKALGKAQAEITRIKNTGRKGPFSNEQRSRIRSLLTQGVLDFFKSAGGKPPENLSGVLGKLTSELLLTSLGVPPGLSLIEPLIKDKVVELAKKFAGKTASSLKVESELIDFAQGEIKKKLGNAASPLSDEDKLFLKELAKQATVANPPENSNDLLDKVQSELQIQMAETLLALANESQLPGAKVRGEELSKVRSALEKLGLIPSRTLGERFGLRRTVIIIPPVLIPDGRVMADPKLASLVDRAETQGYSAQSLDSNYNILRQVSLNAFAKLIDRNRIEISTASYVNQGAVNADVRKLDQSESLQVFQLDLDGGNKTVDVVGLSEQRSFRVQQMLEKVKDQIERNQIENIIVMIPPGGLPVEFGEAMDSFRSQFIGKSDLRLDIAIVGNSKIPIELRDLVTRTQGSIITVTDLDEIGAAAQRLAGVQTQGTWVSIPEQGILDLEALKLPVQPKPTNEVKNSKDPCDLNPAADPSKPREYLWQRFQKLRRIVAISGGKDSVTKIALKPFYVDGGTKYQMVLGLSQPITVMGLTPKVERVPGTLPNTSDPEAMTSRSAEFLERYKNPKMQLVRTEQGKPVDPNQAIVAFAQVPDLAFRHDLSSPLTLVFDLPEGLTPGWYAPVLELPKSAFQLFADPKPATEAYRYYRGNQIHFTFSVSSQSSQAQMVASYEQDLPSNGRDSIERGIVMPNQTEAVITAVLTAGRAVRGAEVKGYLQRITQGTDEILPEEVIFNDNGDEADKVKDDGIYTGKIKVPKRRSSTAEYRLFVQGTSIPEKSTLVPAGEPGLALAVETNKAIARGEDPDKAEKSAKTVVTGEATKSPGFQRATSLQLFITASLGQ